MCKTKFALILVVMFLETSSGCDRSQPQSVEAPKVTPQMLLGSWEGGNDGDIQKREAFFGKDGNGSLRVFIKNDTFNGSIRFDFAYQIDGQSSTIGLTNTSGSKTGGSTGSAELINESQLRFKLDSQDCVLTRVMAKP